MYIVTTHKPTPVATTAGGQLSTAQLEPGQWGERVFPFDAQCLLIEQMVLLLHTAMPDYPLHCTPLCLITHYTAAHRYAFMWQLTHYTIDVYATQL